MNTQWHYADREQQQRGPVDASWLQAAFGRGEVHAHTLVWREGLSSWQPLAAVATELGIAVPAGAPPPLPRPRPVTIAQPSGSPWLVIALVLGFGGIAVLGILAAIAIPAYQDYTQRAKLSEALNRAAPVKLALTEFRLEHERCPSNEDEGFAAPTSHAASTLHLQSIQLGTLADLPAHCTIELRFFGLRPAQEDSLWLIQAEAQGGWRYRTTLPPRMLPAMVRGQLENAR